MISHIQIREKLIKISLQIEWILTIILQNLEQKSIQCVKKRYVVIFNNKDKNPHLIRLKKKIQEKIVNTIEIDVE